MAKKISKKYFSPSKKTSKTSSAVKLKIKNVMHSVATSGTSVHVISHKDGWAVKREGISRASKVYDKKPRAVTHAKSLAKKSSGLLIVHRKDGKIQSREKTTKSKK